MRRQGEFTLRLLQLRLRKIGRELKQFLWQMKVTLAHRTNFVQLLLATTLNK